MVLSRLRIAVILVCRSRFESTTKFHSCCDAPNVGYPQQKIHLFLSSFLTDLTVFFSFREMVIFLSHPYLSKAGHPVLRIPDLQGRACRPSWERGEVAGSRWEAFWSAPEELTKWWLFLREITSLWFWALFWEFPSWSEFPKNKDGGQILSIGEIIVSFDNMRDISWTHNYFRLLRSDDSQAYRYTTLYISNSRGSSWWTGSFCRLDVYFI
jgi:hypothetical protein